MQTFHHTASWMLFVPTVFQDFPECVAKKVAQSPANYGAVVEAQQRHKLHIWLRKFFRVAADRFAPYGHSAGKLNLAL